MATELAKKPIRNSASARPNITSFDSGYEHSLEHWIDLQRLVEDAENLRAPERARAAPIAS